MLELLQPSVRDRSEALGSEFAAGQPFRHIVLDDFLDPAFCGRLIAEFPAFEARNAINELGAVGRKAVRPQISRIAASYAEFDRLIRSREFLGWLAKLTSIERLVYDPDYIGGGTHENLSGQDLDFHVDFNYHPRRPLYRRLNLILFLNPEWREEWGGSLELRQDPWRQEAPGKAILPLANRCVVFETTEASWHGFRRICLPDGLEGLSRRSIAVYFYTKARPEQGAAPSHGTIYVPRPLPERLQTGHALDPQDMWELEVLFNRRDRQIQYLYEREMEFSKTLEGIYRSPSFRLGRALTWPLRKLLGKG